MAYTDDQIREKVKLLQEKGAPVDKIKQFVQLAKKEQKPMSPEAPKDNLVNKIRKSPLGLLTGAAAGFVTGTGATLSEFGEKGIKAVGRTLTPKSLEETLGFSADKKTSGEIARESEFLKPKGGFEKAGKFAEQVGEFVIPAAKATKLINLVKGSKLLGASKTASKGVNALKALGRVGTTAGVEGVTAGSVATLQEGEINDDVKLAAAIGGGLPVAGAGIKGLLKPLVGKGRLVTKATGITPTLKSQLDDVAKSKIKVKGKLKDAYESIDDFFIEEGFFNRGLGTTRDDFVQHAENLLETTKASKKELVKDISTKISTKKIPKWKLLLDRLDKGYRTIGQEENLLRLRGLKDKANVKASELEFVRGLADDLLFSEADKPAAEGIRKVIKPIRNILQDVETTGAVKKANVKIRVLSKLLGVGKKTNPLKRAAEKDASGSVVKNLLGGVGGAGTASFIPGLQPFAPVIAATGLTEAITSTPQVSSALLKFLSKKGVQKQLPKTVKSALKGVLIKGSSSD